MNPLDKLRAIYVLPKNKDHERSIVEKTNEKGVIYFHRQFQVSRRFLKSKLKIKEKRLPISLDEFRLQITISIVLEHAKEEGYDLVFIIWDSDFEVNIESIDVNDDLIIGKSCMLVDSSKVYIFEDPTITIDQIKQQYDSRVHKSN